MERAECEDHEYNTSAIKPEIGDAMHDEPRVVEMEREGRITFHPEQLKWLERMFPEVIPNPASTPAEMYFQGGSRRVVAAVRAKVK